MCRGLAGGGVGEVGPPRRHNIIQCPYVRGAFLFQASLVTDRSTGAERWVIGLRLVNRRDIAR